VGAAAVVTAAARAGRRYWWQILPVAVVVCIVTALAGVVVDDLVDRTNVPLSLLTDLTASAVSVLGAVFLSGFLCRLVGGPKDGLEGASVREVLRTLSWGRLVGADLMVALLVVIGLIAFVIPGLVAATLFAVVGPVIDIESRPVVAALRRSAHLVRPRFWTVALLVTLPVALASVFDALAPDSTSLRAVLETLAIRGVADALLEVAIGLISVQLCFRLIALDLAPAAAGGQGSGEKAATGCRTDVDGTEPGRGSRPVTP